MGSIQSLGIINALKTGDARIDMIIALLMPLAVNFLLTSGRQLLKKIQEAWKRWLGQDIKNTPYHERTITYRSQHNQEGNYSYTTSADREDVKNSILLKAIRLYLHHTVDLNLKRAEVDLTELDDKSSQGSLRRHIYSRTIAGVLSRYKIIKNPPAQEWHKLGVFGDTEKPMKGSLVELQVEHQDTANGGQSSGGGNSDGSGDKKNVQVMRFRFRSLDGGAIDDFIQRAYNWYLEELRKSEDTKTRYYYDLQSESSGRWGSDNNGTNDSQQCKYTRFELSSEKTFDSLFFPEKEPVLQLVENFVNKKGKYAIKGYPNKLGILLHGPPGTGKTSFIKALAERTNRNIVNVPLSKISTNAELNSVVFGKKFFCADLNMHVNMDFKDVIFVMEDIDAASDVVKRRDGKKTAEVIQTSHIQMPTPKSLWMMMLESEDANCKKLVTRLGGISERLKAEATKPDVVQAAARRVMTFPALGLVGESEDQTLQKLSADAIKSSQSMMNQISSVDKILGFHAKKIERLLDEGAEADETLVDELLGIEKPMLPAVVACPQNLSRDMSYSKYDGSDEVHMEMKGMREALMKYPLMTGQTSPRSQGKEDDDREWRPAYMDYYKSKDSLNLSGILNVLDGICDTPSRLVIMTTNHPEQLDPALIRPGRVDKKLRLGYMAAPDIFAMLEHYFETTVTNKQRMRIDRAVEGDTVQGLPSLHLTPAQVEQMASEYENVDDMIQGLEEKAMSIPISASKIPERAGSVASSEIAFGY